MKDKDYKFKLWIIREVLKRKIVYCDPMGVDTDDL